MQKREAKFQIWFKHYLQSEWKSGSAAFELKVTQSDMLAKRAVLPHQVQSLLMAKRGLLYFKIPDDSRSAKPFDCFVLQEAEAYLVVKFRSGVVMIPIEAYVKIKSSLKFEKAKQIGSVLQL